jgi:hypothetical protein
MIFQRGIRIKEDTPCLYVDEVNPDNLSSLEPDIIFVDEAQFFFQKRYL